MVARRAQANELRHRRLTALSIATTEQLRIATALCRPSYGSRFRNGAAPTEFRFPRGGPPQSRCREAPSCHPHSGLRLLR